VSKKNNKVLFVAIAIFLALAIFGAAVFGGYFGKGSQSNPASQELAMQDETPFVVENTASDDGADQSAASSAPFKLDLDQAMATRSIGNPNAPVKIVEYASLTCSHCAHFHTDILPQLKTKLIDTGEVYLEFQEFPLNAPALDASLLARCLPADRYESFVGLLFKTQEDWTTRPDYINILKQNAKLAGLSEEGADTCLKSTVLRQAIGTRIQKASDEWKISSTPTFVFNGGQEFIRGAMPIEEFERIIAKINGGGEEAAPAPAPAPADTVSTEEAAPETTPAPEAAPAVDEETPAAAEETVPEAVPAEETPAE
jgi:protein-disulfide isomerase